MLQSPYMLQKIITLAHGIFLCANLLCVMQGAFIQTIEALSTLGYIVMVSNQGRYFRLASYLASFTQKSIVIAMGIPALKVLSFFLDESPIFSSFVQSCEQLALKYVLVSNTLKNSFAASWPAALSLYHVSHL